MAFVLPQPRTPSLDLPFGSRVSRRSCSPITDDGSVRRYNIRSHSPESHVSISSLPAAKIVGKKENSRRKENPPLEDASNSRQTAQLYDNISLSSSPRRSWSWNYGGDHSNTTALKPKDDKLCRAVTKDPEPIGINRTLGIRTVSESSEPSALDYDTEHGDCGQQTKAVLVPIIEAPDSSPEVVSGNRPSSPFKRWLRTLKRRHIAPLDCAEDVAYHTTLDRGNEELFQTPSGHLAPTNRLEKSPSSASSIAFISAVKSASVTIASFSVYPMSRRSAQTSYLRRGESQVDMRYGRSSFDGEDIPASPLMDDGTWSRSVRRHRIVQEIVSSEESYVRDLKTLINVSV
jgi:hypothetical protein